MTSDARSGSPTPETAPADAQAALQRAMNCDCWDLVYQMEPEAPLPGHICAPTWPATVRTWQHEEQIAGTGYPLEYKGHYVTLAVRQWVAEPAENRLLADALEASPYWQHALKLLATLSVDDLVVSFLDTEDPLVPWKPPGTLVPFHALLRSHALPDTPSVRRYLYKRALGFAAPPLPRREVLVTTLLDARPYTPFGEGAEHSIPPAQSVDDEYAWATGELDKAALRVRKRHRAWLEAMRPHLFSAKAQGRLAARRECPDRIIHISYLAAGRARRRLHALALEYRTKGGAVSEYVERYIGNTQSMVYRILHDRDLDTHREPGWQRTIRQEVRRLLEDPVALQRLLDEGPDT